MLNRLPVVCVLLAALIFSEGGFALECYECTSQGNSACGDSLDTSQVRTTECKAKEVCFKITKPTTDVDGVIIERGCSPQSLCHSLSIPCDLCQEKLCNSSATVVPSIFVTIAFSLIYCFHYLG